ncbi:cardiolipin synthetase [Klebsiella pneumoniae]|uniref:Cardiolipin synthetase n=1 Tax=Klebsiella pneumoniae TaxID=573 RepID=A0A2X3EUM2_KLEPN|nr:cardiolipin synthetase [Klebsiella pneumoniae]
MKCRWQEGNRITLLRMATSTIRAVCGIGRASRRVILESFIWLKMR